MKHRKINFIKYFFAALLMVMNSSGAFANSSIDIDLPTDYRKLAVHDELQTRLQELDRNRRPSHLFINDEEWLKFQRNGKNSGKYATHSLNSPSSNRAMREEIESSSKYRGGVMEQPSGIEGNALDGFGLKGTIKLN